MKLTTHIENYKQTLNKTQQKQFNKILNVFKNPRSQGVSRFQSGEELVNSVGK